LVGISTATTITFIVFSFSIQAITFNMILGSLAKILKQILLSTAIFGLLILIYFLINTKNFGFYIPHLSDWYGQILVFLIIQAPIFLFFNKRYNLIKFFRENILKR